MVDPKQLLLMTAITTGVCAIFMFVNWLLNRGMPGVRDWLLFAVLTGFGCSLLAANTLPLTWSIFIPNIAMFLGLFYLARGVELFFETPALRWPWYLLALITVPAFGYYLYVDYNFIARVVINYSFWALALVLCLRALILGQDRLSKHFSAAHWAFALSCLCMLVVFTLRLIMAGGFSAADTLATVNWVNKFISTSVTVMPLLLCFSLCLLCNSRREKELATLQRKAEQNAQAKERFLTLLSHELRTPLNAIVGHAESLKKVPREPGKHKQLCDTIVHAAMSMSDLANQVLLQAKGEHTQQHKSSVSVVRLSEELLRLLQPLANAKALDLQLEVSGINPEDRHQVEQDTLALVLRNLLSNAIKYTDSGSVTLCIEAEAERMGKQTLQFLINDTGKGLSQEQLDKLFTPFAGNDSSSSINESAGVGLVLCKQLLNSMDAELGVQSEQGKGTTFSFSVVAELGEQQQAEAPRSGELLPLSVLVVEDNAINIAVMNDYLAEMVTQYRIVRTLGEAEVALLEHHYGLMFLDMRLPDGNGLQWYKSDFQKLGCNSEVPVIALTGDSEPQLRRDCLRAGMQECLTKPVTPRQLYTTMQRVSKAKASRLECKSLVDQARFMACVEQQEPQVLATKLMYLADRFEYEIAQIKGLAELNIIDLASEKLSYIEQEALQLGMVNFAEFTQAIAEQLRFSDEYIDWDALAGVARQSVERLMELHNQVIQPGDPQAEKDLTA